MPIQRSGARENGHDHLRQTDDVDTAYLVTQTGNTRLSASRPAPDTDEVILAQEGVMRSCPDYDAQDIILLGPKNSERHPSRDLPKMKPQGRQTPSTRQPTSSQSGVRQSTSSQPGVRQPTSSRSAVRQPTNTRDAVRQPTNAQSAVRQPTSTRDAVRQPSDRLRSAQQPARKTEPVRQTTQPRGSEKLRPQTQDQGRSYHWLVPVGIVMIISIACYLLLYGAWVGSKSVYNNLTYGSGTRTSQLDTVVGDHDSVSSPTHFIALNLHGTIDIVEFPGGDVTHAKVYPGPRLLWSNADRAVITLEKKDINGDQRPDIVIHVQGDTDMLFHQTTANFVLLNNGAGFSPMTPLQS